MEYIFGVIVSLLAQAMKKSLGTDTLGTYIAVAALSVLAAGAYVFFKDTSLWPVIVQIAVVAGAVHNFILRRFE